MDPYMVAGAVVATKAAELNTKLEWEQEERCLHDLMKKHSTFIGILIELYVQRLKEKEVLHEWEQLNKNRSLWIRKLEDATNETYASFYKPLSNDWEAVPWKSPDAVTFMVMQSTLGSSRKNSGLVPGSVSGNRVINSVANKMGVGCADEFDFFMKFYRDIGLFDFYIVCDEVAVEQTVGELMFGCNLLSFPVTDGGVEPVGLRRGHSSGSSALQTPGSEKKDDYKRFFIQFGKCLKLGVYEDFINRIRVAELLSFNASKSGDEQISLEKYIDRMIECQTNIYYITGESITAASSSPLLETLRNKGVELFAERVESRAGCVTIMEEQALNISFAEFEALKEEFLRQIKLCMRYGAVVASMVSDEQGNIITLSYVAFTDDESLIGEHAKNQIIINPLQTLFDVKCLIGCRFKDSTVQKDIELLSFKIVDKDSSCDGIACDKGKVAREKGSPHLSQWKRN